MCKKLETLEGRVIREMAKKIREISQWNKNESQEFLSFHIKHSNLATITDVLHPIKKDDLENLFLHLPPGHTKYDTRNEHEPAINRSILHYLQHFVEEKEVEIINLAFGKEG